MILLKIDLRGGRLLIEKLKSLIKRYKQDKEKLNNKIEWLNEFRDVITFISKQKISSELSRKDRIRYWKLFWKIKLGLV